MPAGVTLAEHFCGSFTKTFSVVLGMLRVPTGLVIGTPGYQLTGGARGESVVICSVLVIFGQIPNKTVFFGMNGYLLVGLRGPMTGPAIQPIHPGAGTDGTTDCTQFSVMTSLDSNSRASGRACTSSSQLRGLCSDTATVIPPPESLQLRESDARPT